jgi:GrpB-like predicted nucleotidyltransferase (UPF0157 family)
MNEDRSQVYKNRKYEIVSYNPKWPESFLFYAEKIRKIFGNVIIEHIGSTAIPGMSGKSCIDLLVELEEISIVDSHVGEMEKAGFIYSGQFVMENSRLFRVMDGQTLLANIHFFPIGHSHCTEMIGFRDYFRNHPEEVVVYSNLKNTLYAKYPDDYASYRKYKDVYVKSLNERIKYD